MDKVVTALLATAHLSRRRLAVPVGLGLAALTLASLPLAASLAETVKPERTIRQSERYFIDENMFLMLPKACAVLTVPGQLARFVFTSPVRVEKDPAARAIVATGSALAVQKRDEQTEEAHEAPPVQATDGALAVQETAEQEDFL